MVVVIPVEAVPPISLVAEPAGQFVQKVLGAFAVEYVPFPQSSHAAAIKASVLNFPAPQLLQMLLAPVPPMEDFPAAHVVQTAPAKETVPTKQSLQSLVDVPAGADFPATQLIHSVASFSAIVYLPAGQREQALALTNGFNSGLDMKEPLLQQPSRP